MAQIQKKFIASDAVDGAKIRLDNAQSLRARNAANSADVNVLSVNSSDKIVFASVPQSPSDAVSGNDVVRFSQFSAALDGLKPKAAVVVASTGNIDLSVAADPSPIDGHTIANGDRVLLWQQSTSSQNGIYVAVTATDPTSWIRSSDMDAPSEIPGAYTVAEFGTLYQGVLFVSTSSPGTIGVDPINFAMRVISSYTGGDMISVSSNVISVDLASVSGLESSNPGNAAGQLRVKLEASNPSLQIDGSNQLGAKLDAAGAVIKGASGLSVNVDNSTIDISANALEVKAGGITNTQVSASAGIVYSKLSLTGSIVNADVSSSAAIVYSKLNLAASVLASDMNSGAATAGQILTANGTGGASYASPATAAVASSEQITLGSGDISAQYVDLAFPIQGSSATANSLSLSVVGGPVQLKGVDYTVSLVGGAGGVTRVSFAGDLATGGGAALVSGDILMVNYSH